MISDYITNNTYIHRPRFLKIENIYLKIQNFNFKYYYFKINYKILAASAPSVPHLAPRVENGSFWVVKI